MFLKFYEYSALYLIQIIVPFCVIEVLDSKRVLNTKKAITSSMEFVDVATFIGREITTVLKMAMDNVILELCDSCDYFVRVTTLIM